MKKYYKILILFVIVMLFVGSYYIFIYDHSAAEDNIDYIKIENNLNSSVLRATGSIIPEKEVDIKSAISGKVIKADFSEGEKVNNNEELIKYDDKLITNEIKNLKVKKEKANLTLKQSKIKEEEAKAALELEKIRLNNAKNSSFESLKYEIRQAEINLKEGKYKLDKYNHLLEKDALELSKKEDQEYKVKILENKLNLAKQKLADRKKEISEKIKEREKSLVQAEKQYLNAKMNYEISKKSFEEAEVAYERALEKNKDYYINSPITGIIKEKSVEEGEFVQPGQNLYKIASNNYLIKISPDERELGLLKENDTAYISPEAYPDRKIKAKLAKISPSVDSEKGTIDVYYRPVAEVEDLVFDMTVSVDVINEKQQKNKIYIPENYLVNENQVYFYNKKNKVELIKIKIGDYNEGKVGVKAGLTKGDIIVNPEDVEEGQKLDIGTKG